MISIVTLIKHLSAHPCALIPQHMRVREGRGRATVNLWEPKQWHAAWNCIQGKISRNSDRSVSRSLCSWNWFKTSLKTCTVIMRDSSYYQPIKSLLQQWSDALYEHLNRFCVLSLIILLILAVKRWRSFPNAFKLKVIADKTQNPIFLNYDIANLTKNTCHTCLPVTTWCFCNCVVS